MVDGKWTFDWDLFGADIPHVVRAMDNVIDETIYPLPEQEAEAKAKRRMGLGITGLGNCLGVLGITYGTSGATSFVSDVMQFLANECYMASALLAKEKGAFPAFDQEKYLQSEYIIRLDDDVRSAIAQYGIRNSHLISIAPTGTISLTADNVSSGLEPVFSHKYERKIQTMNGEITYVVEDYAYSTWGVECITADEIGVNQHVDMLCAAQYWVDSACSKTCNVGDDVTWDEFKDVYMRAYDGGAKGCTTFRMSGKRYGILNASYSEDVVEEGAACYYDPDTGLKSCE